jgi:hypothetical protein
MTTNKKEIYKSDYIEETWKPHKNRDVATGWTLKIMKTVTELNVNKDKTKHESVETTEPWHTKMTLKNSSYFLL